VKTLAFCLLFAVSVAAAQSAATDSSAQMPEVGHVSTTNVDKSVDPCSDFYHYACGNILNTHAMPADEIYWGPFGRIALWNDAVLHQALIDAAAKREGRTAVEQKIGDYWTACMDQSAANTQSLQQLQPLLSAVDQMKAMSQLAPVLARIHTSFYAAWEGGDNQTNVAVFGYGPTPDFNNARSVVASFDQGGLSLPGRDFYLNDDAKSKEIRDKFVAYVSRMLQLSGTTAPQADAEAREILAMETNMAKSQMDVIKRRDPKNLNHRMSLAQVKALTPSFNFDEYLKDVHSPSSSIYIVTTPEFFQALDQWIRTEPVDHWRSYLRFHILQKAASSLSDDFVNASFEFNDKQLFGQQQIQPRWRRCVARTDRDLGEALGQAYVARAFPPASKQRMLTMVADLKSALDRDIEAADWMQPQTKAAAHRKLAAQIEKIGYPDHWRDYSSLNITAESNLGNIERAAAFESNRQMQKIGKPLDRMEWGMTPPTVNAYENPQENTINFPAGILQPPFFDADADDAINYGAIGVVIGHETIHGFDDQGRKFDANGDLKDWWTDQDAKNYDERGNCIAEEYTQLVPEAGVKQNGRLTQGEDTADNGGIYIAMAALRSDLMRQGKTLDDKGADGLTNLQRFFLGYANDWCGSFRPEAMRTIVLTNPHSLDQYRVNNVVANMPEFQKAFSCRVGAPLVHAKRCHIW